MYVHEIYFGVVPGKYAVWAAHAHNNLAVMSRMEGLALMRILRDRKDPNRFISHRVWRSKADSDRALASPEVQLATSANPKLGLSEGFETIVREYDLLDIVFGMERGVTGYSGAFGFINHIRVHAPKGKQSIWHAYRRNCASVFARQPGLVSYEIAADRSDPEMFLVMRSWKDKEASLLGPEGKPNEEVKLVVKPATDHKLYEGARGSQYLELDVWDAVYGPGAAEALRDFMRNLKPV